MNAHNTMRVANNFAVFYDRAQAAQGLTERLMPYIDSDAVVIAVPHGGAPIGARIAQNLHLPFHVMPCKRIKHPAHPEESIASVTPEEVVIHPNCGSIPQDYITHQVQMFQHALAADRGYYHGNEPLPSLRGRTILLVDDLLRTPDTLIACLRSIQRQHPAKIVVAVPVATLEAIARIKPEAHETIALITTADGSRLGDFYADYPRISDEEVRDLIVSRRDSRET